MSRMNNALYVPVDSVRRMVYIPGRCMYPQS